MVIEIVNNTISKERTLYAELVNALKNEED